MLAVSDPANDVQYWREERDALGSVAVPADRLWGAQTQRAISNFRVGAERWQWDRSVIRAFGYSQEMCAALANVQNSFQLSEHKAALIAEAAQEVIDGKWDS